MKIKIVRGEDFAATAADFAIAQIVRKPTSVIGLAGGNTTKPIHAELVQSLKQNESLISGLSFVNVDEYFGASKNCLGTCYGRMIDQLLGPLEIDASRIHLFDPEADEADAECQHVRDTIQSLGGIDFLFLGIGLNGHVGFCNPGTPFDSTAFAFPFRESFRYEKQVGFGGIDHTPTIGMTLGIMDFLNARQILLVANSSAKADIIARIVNGPITEDVPATVFRLHSNSTLLLDEAAASKL